MSGAAGAQATFAPANHRFRIMSALSLLSVPASPVSGLPQGSAGETASGFGALLAVETGEDAALPDSTQGQVANLDEDVPTDPSGAPGLTTTVAVAPAPLPLKSASGADQTLDGEPSGAGDSAGAQEPGRYSGGSEPALRLDAIPGAASAGTAPAGGASDAKVRPGLAADGASKLPDGETAANMAGSAVMKEADPRTGATPAVPPLMPAPLRPLAERTSRPLDASAAGTGDAADAVESASGKAATPASAAPVTASTAAARDTIAVAPAAVPVSDGAPAEFAPSGDGAAAETDAPAVLKEAALSQLSRVAIEATAQIAAQILRRLEGRSTRFEIALTPAELGRVDVKLDIDSEGRLQARLAFDNPAAATDLRGRADELRRQLEDAGFDLGENALEFAERDSGSSAFDRGQDGRSGQSRAFSAAARLNAEIDVAQPPGWMALTLSPSGVDMKV